MKERKVYKSVKSGSIYAGTPERVVKGMMEQQGRFKNPRKFMKYIVCKLLQSGKRIKVSSSISERNFLQLLCAQEILIENPKKFDSSVLPGPALKMRD